MFHGIPSLLAVLAASILLCFGALAQQAPDLPRTVPLPLPLFPDTAWTQSASAASVLAGSPNQIQATFRVLCGDESYLNYPSPTDWPFPDINYDHYSVSISAAGAGYQSVSICDYWGSTGWPGPKWPNNVDGGPIAVPSCAGDARPAGPQNQDADGHLVLFHAASGVAYDFWNATTVRTGPWAHPFWRG